MNQKEILHQYLTLSEASGSRWPEMLLRSVQFDTTWENSQNVKIVGEDYTCKECNDEVNRKSHLTKHKEAVHVGNLSQKLL